MTPAQQAMSDLERHLISNGNPEPFEMSALIDKLICERIKEALDAPTMQEVTARPNQGRAICLFCSGATVDNICLACDQ